MNFIGGYVFLTGGCPNEMGAVHLNLKAVRLNFVCVGKYTVTRSHQPDQRGNVTAAGTGMCCLLGRILPVTFALGVARNRNAGGLCLVLGSDQSGDGVTNGYHMR